MSDDAAIKLEKLTVEDVSSVQKKLQVEVGAATVDAELQRAYERLRQTAQLRGFRRGRAPRSVLERMFGEQVRQEVLSQLVELSLRQAIVERGLAVVGTPDIQADLPQRGSALSYAAVLDVRPTITVGDISGLRAERPAPVVEDAEVERVIASLRESAAELRPIEDRHVVEAGDIVTIDMTSRLDGGEPHRREGVMLEAGTGTFPLAVERQLVGQHRGAHLTVRVPYPPDYANPNLAGKTAEFDVEIRDLRAKVLPPLDDDLARDHGRCDSLDELRARVRSDLEARAVERADNQVRDALLEQLLERHDFDIPPSLVERRCDALLSALDVRLPEGPDRERVASQYRDEIRPRAARAVRIELLLDAIAEREGIVVDDDALRGEIEQLALREAQTPERVRGFYERPEARAALRSRLVRDRTLAKLVTGATIVSVGPRKDVAREQ